MSSQESLKILLNGKSHLGGLIFHLFFKKCVGIGLIIWSFVFLIGINITKKNHNNKKLFK